jgi:pimeloyl-ACP methyl ester carboxylesterase
MHAVRPANASSETTVPKEALAAARPGTIFKTWPLEGAMPAGYAGVKILYRSTDFDDEPVAVTGAILFPESAADTGGREVVAWAHPTVGVVPQCAPTLVPDFASTIEGLDALVAKRYVIAATDYTGLGTGTPPHPYLVGVSEARAVIDSVRAARQLTRAHAGDRFAVWGHSQGGHATLFTGALAGAYAPELSLVGVAAAAPVTDIAKMYRSTRDDLGGRALISMIILSWSRTFGPSSGISIHELVDEKENGRFNTLAKDCLQTVADSDKFLQDGMALSAPFLKVDPLAYAPLSSRMEENTPGQLAPGVPAFIAQGTDDIIVPPSITRGHVAALCQGGTSVRFDFVAGADHFTIPGKSAATAAQWIADRFEGLPAPSDCALLPGASAAAAAR